MRNASPKLTGLIEPVVRGLGYELVGVEFDGHQRTLRVYIDQPQGVSVEDCSRVSHQLSGLLDVEDPIPGPYSLEISSPGIDRPLFTLEHYLRYVGEEIRCELSVPLNGRRRFKGHLREVKDGKILLDCDGQTVEIPYSMIDKGRLVPDYQALMKGKGHGE